ncbi:MAG: PIN domain nuclease, partial [Burkholderiaceae bacterium]|nr:PIN domain nuclease [Burkholderiaceae bacterium]
MLVVDSSVWIGFFNGYDAPAAELLGHLLDHGEVRIVVPDLVLFEVLRGFRLEHELRAARQLMQGLEV